MCHAFLNDARFYRFLFDIDQDIARQVQAGGCSCGGVLHSACYPRKPRGIRSNWDESYNTRLSFCCAEEDCRRRSTPPSVRFLGRKVYLGDCHLGDRSGTRPHQQASEAVGRATRPMATDPCALAQVVAGDLSCQSLLAGSKRPFHTACADRSVARRPAGPTRRKGSLSASLPFAAPVDTAYNHLMVRQFEGDHRPAEDVIARP